MYIQSCYNNIIAEATGKTEDVIVSDAHRDFWLNADEALAYKLVDRVIKNRSELS